MSEVSQEIASSLYPHLKPEDRERAVYNLNRYFDVVLGIYLRLEREAEEHGRRRYTQIMRLLTSCPRLSTLKR